MSATKAKASHRDRVPTGSARKRSAVGLTVLLLSSTAAILTRAPAVSAAVIGTAPSNSSGTRTCNSAGFACTTGGYSGRSTWGYPVNRGHNCTNYAAFRLAQNGAGNPGNLGNARDWASNSRAKGFRVDQTPVAGAIAQWTNPNLGHVAYVEVVTSTYFETTSDNWGGGTNRYRFPRSAAARMNFIHIRDVAPTPPPPPPPAPKPYPGHELQPITGDWNGDGRTDIGLRRVSTGMFYLRTGPSYAQTTVSWAPGAG